MQKTVVTVILTIFKICNQATSFARLFIETHFARSNYGKIKNKQKDVRQNGRKQNEHTEFPKTNLIAKFSKKKD